MTTETETAVTLPQTTGHPEPLELDEGRKDLP